MTKLSIEADSPAELLALGRTLFAGAPLPAAEVISSDRPVIALSPGEPITAGFIESGNAATEVPAQEKKTRAPRTPKEQTDEKQGIDFAAKTAEKKAAKEAAEAAPPADNLDDVFGDTPPAPVEAPATPPTAEKVEKVDLDLIRKAYGPKYTNPATKAAVIALIGEYGHTKLGDFYTNTDPGQIKEFYDRLLKIG